MADVFISYSRRDREFVRQLHEALAERGRDSWVDWEGIPPTADWLAEIYAGIEAADTVIFILSPDSTRSDVCRRELEHAVSRNKRLVPILRRDVDEAAVPSPLGTLNWVFFRDSDDFDEALAALLVALDTDLAWVKVHTRLLVRAVEWESRGKNPSFLLRGSDLREAEQWLLGAGGAKEPSALHTEYVVASRRAETARQRLLLAGVSAALAVSISLAIFGWIQRGQAIEQAEAAEVARAQAEQQRQVADEQRGLAEEQRRVAEDRRREAEAERERAEQQRRTAVSRQLAAEFHVLAEDKLDLALLLSVEAFRVDDTYEARNALFGGYAARPALLSYLNGHSNRVRSVTYSPDGTLIASGGADGTIRLWDAAAGRPAGPPLASPGQSIFSGVFRPDGKALAAGLQDGSVRLWDMATGQLIWSAMDAHTSPVYSVAFSPDGRLLATAAGDGTIRLLDVAEGRPIGPPLTGHTHIAGSVAFSPDGQVLASGSFDETIRFWDPASGRPLGGPLSAGALVFAVAFSPDGDGLAYSTGNGARIIWRAGTEAGWPAGPDPAQLVTAIRGHVGNVWSLAWSPDGRAVATGGDDRTVRLAATSREQREARAEVLGTHAEAIFSVAFSPDGKAIASGSADRTVARWAADPGRPVGQTLSGSADEVFDLAFSPDGAILASVAGATIGFWDVPRRRATDGPFNLYVPVALAFSPDGRLLASSESVGIAIYDLATRKPIGQTLFGHLVQPGALAFSPDSRILASGERDRLVHLWDVATGQPSGPPLSGHSEPVLTIAFSPDGRTLASAGMDGVVKLWNPATGQREREFAYPSPVVQSVAFSPDGRTLAAAGGDSAIWLLDIAAGQSLKPPLAGHRRRVARIAFSPDGTMLASAAMDGTVRLWDVASGRPIGGPLDDAIRGEPAPDRPVETGMVLSLAFSPDGRLLATGNSLGEIRLRDVGVDAWMAAACVRANRNLTEEEWRQYRGDEPYRATCPDLPPPDR